MPSLLSRSLLILVCLLSSWQPVSGQVNIEEMRSSLEAARIELDAATAEATKKSSPETKATAEAARVAMERELGIVRTEIKIMKSRGESAAPLRTLLAEYGAGLSELGTDIGAWKTQVSAWLSQARSLATDRLPIWVGKALLFFAILALFFLLSRIAARIVTRILASSRLQVSNLLRQFFVMIATKLTLMAGVLVALSNIGINVGPLLAGVGVAGFVIGFALQDTLGNFAAGVMILLYRPFDVGDTIEAAGVRGKVDSMSLVSASILTPDNQLLIVPNSKIWGGVITNVTAKATRRVDLTFGISYDDDIDLATAILAELAKEHPLVLDEPEPMIKVGALADSSVNMLLRPWSKTSDYWSVYWDLTKSVKQRFDKEGITIPFPQREVHLPQQIQAEETPQP